MGIYLKVYFSNFKHSVNTQMYLLATLIMEDIKVVQNFILPEASAYILLNFVQVATLTSSLIAITSSIRS